MSRKMKILDLLLTTSLFFKLNYEMNLLRLVKYQILLVKHGTSYELSRRNLNCVWRSPCTSAHANMKQRIRNDGGFGIFYEIQRVRGSQHGMPPRTTQLTTILTATLVPLVILSTTGRWHALTFQQLQVSWWREILLS